LVRAALSPLPPSDTPPHHPDNYVQAGADWEARDRREQMSWPVHLAYLAGDLAVKAIQTRLESVYPEPHPAAEAVCDSLSLLVGMIHSQVVFSDLSDDNLEEFVKSCLPDDEGDESEGEADVALRGAATVRLRPRARPGCAFSARRCYNQTSFGRAALAVLETGRAAGRFQKGIPPS
jgi:hypothetical protein